MKDDLVNFSLLAMSINNLLNRQCFRATYSIKIIIFCCEESDIRMFNLLDSKEDNQNIPSDSDGHSKFCENTGHF
jgi:hypothetical protein